MILIHPPNPTITKVRFEDTKNQKMAAPIPMIPLLKAIVSSYSFKSALKLTPPKLQLQKKGCVAHSWVNLIGKAFCKHCKKTRLVILPLIPACCFAKFCAVTSDFSPQWHTVNRHGAALELSSCLLSVS